MCLYVNIDLTTRQEGNEKFITQNKTWNLFIWHIEAQGARMMSWQNITNIKNDHVKCTRRSHSNILMWINDIFNGKFYHTQIKANKSK